MGEIADMMLDGTMDPETGEFNFDGDDGPGWPMTGAEAAEYKRAAGRGSGRSRRAAGPYDGPTRYVLTASWRKKIEQFGDIRANDFHHWQVRSGGKLLADWWPHKGKFRISGTMRRGNEGDFIRALAKASA